MAPRVHLQFQTREEVRDNPEIAHSDHLPILTQVPLGEGNEPLNIISLNILGGTDCSGVHPIQFMETPEMNAKRYRRIAAGLAQGVQQHGVEVILLQEASEDIVPALKMYLTDDWEIVADKRTGIVSCYNKQRFTQQSSSLDAVERIRSFTFADKKNKNLAVDVHNIWGLFSPFPKNMERLYRAKLTGSGSSVSVIIGDTNSRIAPLDDRKRNLTTGVIPAIFNKMIGQPVERQVPDHPDGGFYRDAKGGVKQLVTQTLDFTSGEVVHDERTAEEIQIWPEYRMVMCLDDTYQEQVVIGGKTIFAYEGTLQDYCDDNSLIVRMASDSYNNKAVAIRFAPESVAFEFISQHLKSEPAFQIRPVQPTDFADGAEAFHCIFAPLEHVDLLHQAVSALILRNQILAKLDAQILKLSEHHWYFRNTPEKIGCLNDLRDRIAGAVPTSTNEELLEIIANWENDSSSTAVEGGYEPPAEATTNLNIMSTHRNIFFAAKRPKVKTSTQILLEELKSELEITLQSTAQV